METQKSAKEVPDEEIEMTNHQKIVSEVIAIVYPNLQIIMEEKIDKFIEFFQDIEDTKLNMATLSSILGTKKLFTKEEFVSCYKEMKKSFGEVSPEGTMSGKIVVTPYNWEEGVL